MKVYSIKWNVRIKNVNSNISFDFTIWQEKYDILTLVNFFENAYPSYVIVSMKHTVFCKTDE